MKKLVLLVCVLMSGCAAQVVSSNERSVVVQAGARDAGSAQALADVECKKVGRFARLSIKATHNQYVYDCIN